MKTMTFKEASADWAQAGKAFDNGTALVATRRELTKLVSGLRSIAIPRRATTDIRRGSFAMADGHTKFQISLKSIGSIVAKDITHDDQEVVTAMVEPVSTGVAIGAVIVGLIIAGGIFVVGVGVGYAAGDLGEDDESSVTISKGEENVEIDVN